jgi:class 3 adenylate cyclase
MRFEAVRVMPSGDPESQGVPPGGADLPAGTITMLFTDIEGSTRLARSLGNRYQIVLADHHRVLRNAWREHAGREISTEGDSFFIVFRRAQDAVAAAVQAQRELAAHRWPEGADLRVRMGMHTGEPELAQDGDYVGLGVHRAARVAAAAHGGQVLLSEATSRVLEPEELDGVVLRDLGPQRLKDFMELQHLYQLDVDGLQTVFPPLKTLDVQAATELPFVEHASELAAAAQTAIAVESRPHRIRRAIGGVGLLVVLLIGAVGFYYVLRHHPSHTNPSSLVKLSRPGLIQRGPPIALGTYLTIINKHTSTKLRSYSTAQLSTPGVYYELPLTVVGLAHVTLEIEWTLFDDNTRLINYANHPSSTLSAPSDTYSCVIRLWVPVPDGAGKYSAEIDVVHGDMPPFTVVLTKTFRGLAKSPPPAPLSTPTTVPTAAPPPTATVPTGAAPAPTTASTTSTNAATSTTTSTSAASTPTPLVPPAPVISAT